MSGKINLRILLVLWIFLLTAGSAVSTGRIIYVDDDGAADFSTIQAAINDSNNGDTIIVSPGVYFEDIRFLGKNITLTSIDPTDWNVVRETYIWFPWYQEGIVFSGTEDPNCKLTGFNMGNYIVGNHTHATISYCLFQDVGTPCDPIIYTFDGTIINCVLAAGGTICGIKFPAIEQCNALIRNCTITQIMNASIVVGSGISTLENCIIYKNLYGIGVAKGATLNISYCDIEGGQTGVGGGGTVNWGTGNINVDPCFASYAHFNSHWVSGDYHLKSQAGRYDPNSKGWVKDDVTSLCIDAGDPASPIGLEPFPNGGIINMGAYGGTTEASKSYFGEPVCETIVAGDVNGDCVVNLIDLSLMAIHWLEEH